MSCPTAIGARSTSIGAPAAMVEASGFIWETNGQSVANPPTAAAAPVATKRNHGVSNPPKTLSSRFQTLSRLQPVEPPQATHERSKGGCRRPRPPRRQKDHFARLFARNKQSRIVLLAPLPDERKPAIGWLACNALIPRRATIYSDISCNTQTAVTECRL